MDPVAVRLTRLLANRTSLTPDQLTAGAFALGLVAAGCFLLATPRWLTAGAGAYTLSFLLDCTDGKLARLTGRCTVFGAWLDYTLDRLRELCCALALTIGQYGLTHRVGYLYLGLLILVLDMFRYINGLQIRGARRELRALVDGARQAQRHGRGGRDGRAPEPVRWTGEKEGAWRAAAGLRPQAWYGAMRDALARRRIRTHLVGGVEFQMATFVLGPLTGRIIPITTVSGALLVLFELAVIYRLWLSARDCVEGMYEAGLNPMGGH